MPKGVGALHVLSDTAMSAYDRRKTREPEGTGVRAPAPTEAESQAALDAFAEFDAEAPTPCTKCGKLPKDCVWQCQRCGAVAAVIPYPVIGCQCIATTYVCDACLWRSDW